MWIYSFKIIYWLLLEKLLSGTYTLKKWTVHSTYGRYFAAGNIIRFYGKVLPFHTAYFWARSAAIFHFCFYCDHLKTPGHQQVEESNRTFQISEVLQKTAWKNLNAYPKGHSDITFKMFTSDPCVQIYLSRSK